MPALVDAGVGQPEHVEAVAAALGGRALARVLVTHGHSDHVKGIPALQARWPAVDVWRAPRFADGMLVEAGDTTLRVIHTPGHAPDHVCFFDEGAGDLYCGDLARLGGTIVIPARQGGDLRAYLASLRRVRDLAPRRLLPGHGPIIDDPRTLIDQYIRHRQEREQQVRDALQDGCRTAVEIAERIYGPMPDTLARAAVDTIEAHLIKLRSDAAR